MQFAQRQVLAQSSSARVPSARFIKMAQELKQDVRAFPGF